MISVPESWQRCEAGLSGFKNFGSLWRSSRPCVHQRYTVFC